VRYDQQGLLAIADADADARSRDDVDGWTPARGREHADHEIGCPPHALVGATRLDDELMLALREHGQMRPPQGAVDTDRVEKRTLAADA
jgi:hypothetical protein